MSGFSIGSATALSYVFTASITTSTGPIAAGSSSAWARTVKSPSGLQIIRPRSRMARRCAPRATKLTFCPDHASFAP